MTHSNIGSACIFALIAGMICGVGLARSRAQSGGTSSVLPKEMRNDINDASLKVTLRTDKQSYRLTDELAVELSIENVSKNPVYLYATLDWAASASFSIWAKDAKSGKDIPQRFIADALSPPPNSKDDFVRLLPGYSYGVSLKAPIRQLLTKKGTYELTAEYHSPTPAAISFGLPVWSRENGPVSSNPIEKRRPSEKKVAIM